MKNILLLEPRPDAAKQLQFLLKLADYHCTSVRSVEETLNRINLGENTGKKLDLIIIGSQLEPTDGKRLMKECSQGKLPPVVYQQHEGTTLPDYLNDQVKVCLAENLLPCLRECFLDGESEPQHGEMSMTDKKSLPQVDPEPLFSTDSMDGKYLTFVLADEGFGLEIRHVTEIIGIQTVTNIPEMPAYVKGVVNLRGKVIPVIDVRLRFRLPEREYDERTCIIVVDVEERSVGLVVDKVSEVIDIAPEDIEPPPATGKSRGESIQGLGKIGEQVKILLDIEQLLHDEEINNIDHEAEAV